MDKKTLVLKFIEHLENELVALKQAAQATYEAATHEESRPENEYDTRGLEASYLAGAQAKRAGEIDEVISMLKTAQFLAFKPDQKISATAWVELISQGKKTSALLMPKGGGLSLSVEGHSVQIITPNSILGEALLGAKAGETVEVEIHEQLREYQVLSVQ